MKGWIEWREIVSTLHWMRISTKALYLNAWSRVSGTIWEVLEGTTFLEQMWSYWRRCFTGDRLSGFKTPCQSICNTLSLYVFFSDISLSVCLSVSLCPPSLSLCLMSEDKGVNISATVLAPCLPASHDDDNS